VSELSDRYQGETTDELLWIIARALERIAAAIEEHTKLEHPPEKD